MPEIRNTSTENAYQPSLAHVVDMKPFTHDTSLFEVRFQNGELARSFDYRPGQFVEVSVLGTGEAPISICSSPTRQGALELCVRRIGRVTEALHRLHKGALIGVRGPYGNGWPLERLTGNSLLIVSGGLGLAPVRSLLLYALDRRDMFKDIILMYGARSPEDILFKQELEEWAKRRDLKVLVSVDKDTTGVWKGRVGVVTTLFEGVELDPKSTYAAVCVPPVAFKYVAAELTKRGFPGEHILMSLERKMQCGIGKCGYCNVGHKYTCQDGPVFTYWDAINLPEMI